MCSQELCQKYREHRRLGNEMYKSYKRVPMQGNSPWDKQLHVVREKVIAKLI